MWRSMRVIMPWDFDRVPDFEAGRLPEQIDKTRTLEGEAV